MKIINKGTGAGGAQTNINGINFEQETYLGDWIKKAGYLLIEAKMNSTNRTQMFDVFNKQRQKVAIYGRQGKIYLALKEFIGDKFTNDYINEIFSKRMKPDAFILNIKTRTLHIFEKKWQQSSGSVDEKIQTAPYKVEMFEKLIKQFDIKVTYDYILSEYYAAPKFRNEKEYYFDKFKNIKIWTAKENLDKMDVSNYLIVKD